MIKKIVFWGVSVAFFGVIFFLTHDILFTKVLAWRICKADPNPKTFINKTVEYPGSIYWEDNIYPGFDENDRLLMIRNYLDGVHLTTMALNSPDGKIYLYSATKKDWQTSQEIHARKKEGNYYDTMKEEAKTIAARGKTITRQELSQINYKVAFNPVQLTPFQCRYLYSDEVTITENKTNEVIAYNRRLMRRWYLLSPDMAGGRFYFPKAMCGYGEIIRFDEDVLTMYWRKILPPKHNIYLENKLYLREKK